MMLKGRIVKNIAELIKLNNKVYVSAKSHNKDYVVALSGGEVINKIKKVDKDEYGYSARLEGKLVYLKEEWFELDKGVIF